jgi:hypothetical protein
MASKLLRKNYTGIFVQSAVLEYVHKSVVEKSLIFQIFLHEVIIGAGPRYEAPSLNGVTHFLEKLAFSV